MSKLPPQPSRIQSIDLLRGAVMVLMAIDHVRVYSGLPAGGPDPGIFFTRWITHYCAPTFVFFAGASAFLYGRKVDPSVLVRFLVTRGMILVVLELTLIRFGWSFNFRYSEFVLAGVIWMIGWCMILLALFVRMKPATVGIIGLAIIFFQQLFSLVPKALPFIGGFWEFLYTSGNEPLGGIAVLYVLVPWIGVMMAGYGFGKVLLLEPEKRNKLCRIIGLSAIAIFVVGGTMAIFVNQSGDEASPFIFQLLNQRKYPASQLYLLMTLGPVIAFVPWAERAKGAFAQMFIVIGRVPFFYYLMHIPLIHISALIVNVLFLGSAHGEWYDFAPFANVPEESRWSLSLLYTVFLLDVAILYWACRKYASHKQSHPEQIWLKYL